MWVREELHGTGKEGRKEYSGTFSGLFKNIRLTSTSQSFWFIRYRTEYCLSYLKKETLIQISSTELKITKQVGHKIYITSSTTGALRS
jgi:hypothetical protein